MTEEVREAQALFRYGLISEFLDGRTTRTERRNRMRELACSRYTVSWQTEPYKVSVRMLSRWLSGYRRNGFEGLKPAERRDLGTCRAIDFLLQKRLTAVKEATPSISIPEIIDALEESGEAPKGKLKKSTVHRYLQRQGLSRRGKSKGQQQQRLPFRFKLPMDFWVGDVMHSRKEVCGRKVYLIAFLDNASRAVMHAAFCYQEDALNMLQVFRQALLVRGIPNTVYVDHGSAYIDSRFIRTCAHLGIHHKLAPVADGAAKGIIERWFRRVREQFEQYLREGDLKSLDTLNSLFWRWLRSSYHNTPHHGLKGEKPWARYLRLLHEIEHRRLAPDFDFWPLWRTRETRVVRKDGTVSLFGYCLEVPPTIAPKTRVELRFIKEELPENVEVWLDDKKLGDADLADLEANTKRRRWRPKEKSDDNENLPLDPLAKARNTWKGGDSK